MRCSVPIMAGVRLAVLVVILLSTVGSAFRFTVVPGTLKCFTNDPHEEGRYELRYRMANSLAPFVSVSVTSASGRVLLEHEPAKPDAKSIFSLKHRSTIAICFNVAPRAELATSLNVTLNILDAEDAELTRMKKQSYTTSSPIALGAGQGSGALRQMQYIADTLRQMRFSVISASMSDKDVTISIRAVEDVAWKSVYVLVGGMLLITVVNYLRLRRFLVKNKLLGVPSRKVAQ